MASSNPAFRNTNEVIAANTAPSAAYLQEMYDQPSYTMPPMQRERALTLDDVITKTAIVIGVAMVVGAITAYLKIPMIALPAALVGLVLAMIVIFKRSTSPGLILAYAVAEGAFLGAMTGLFESRYPGIAMQAILATAGVFVAMLVLYKSGKIRVTPRFAKMLMIAMGGALIAMIANLILGMFNVNLGLRDGSGLAIVFSIVCIAIAAFSFVMDFEQIDQAVKRGAPEKMAWYFAFGLMVTLVWLYLEILRLLSYLRSD